MPVYIRPYKTGSKSVRMLREVRPEWRIPRRTGRGNLHGTLINWGDSSPLEERLDTCGYVFNLPYFVRVWSDKRNMCNYVNSLDEESKDLFISQTLDRAVAQQWCDDGHAVVVRTLARASCGRGIVIAEPNTQVPSGQVYTKYQKKKHEFRVHVASNGEDCSSSVLCVQRKAKKRGVEYADTRIRNAHSENDVGWVFLSTPLEDVPEVVKTTATEALSVSGLDFAGADVIYNERLNKAWVVELNTAPGIGLTDAQSYIEYFENEMGGV